MQVYLHLKRTCDSGYGRLRGSQRRRHAARLDPPHVRGESVRHCPVDLRALHLGLCQVGLIAYRGAFSGRNLISPYEYSPEAFHPRGFPLDGNSNAV
jgi:hypothetical protein